MIKLQIQQRYRIKEDHLHFGGKEAILHELIGKDVCVMRDVKDRCLAFAVSIESLEEIPENVGEVGK